MKNSVDVVPMRLDNTPTASEVCPVLGKISSLRAKQDDKPELL